MILLSLSPHKKYSYRTPPRLSLGFSPHASLRSSLHWHPTLKGHLLNSCSPSPAKFQLHPFRSRIKLLKTMLIRRSKSFTNFSVRKPKDNNAQSCQSLFNQNVGPVFWKNKFNQVHFQVWVKSIGTLLNLFLWLVNSNIPPTILLAFLWGSTLLRTCWIGKVRRFKQTKTPWPSYSNIEISRFQISKFSSGHPSTPSFPCPISQSSSPSSNHK